MHQHYLFDLQTRHALGLDQLGEAHFELRTLYNFRERLSQHMQETGVNLLDQAFEQVTDAQIEAFQLKTGQQRVDSVLLGSNIRQTGRLQALGTEFLGCFDLQVLFFDLEVFSKDASRPSWYTNGASKKLDQFFGGRSSCSVVKRSVRKKFSPCD
jgi:hypothetical protein